MSNGGQVLRLRYYLYRQEDDLTSAPVVGHDCKGFLSTRKQVLIVKTNVENAYRVHSTGAKNLDRYFTNEKT